jgi:NAD(P)-dependent dehydrogenase (short-subunit alcohol dehydrogenase family)
MFYICVLELHFIFKERWWLIFVGFIVYAACLTKEGVDGLKKLDVGDNLRPVKMSVCSQLDVNRVIEKIKREEGKLFCLINNAGIADGTFLELTSMESWEKTIQVNLIGAIRMCKAAIPLLRDFGSGSRIINISSAASFATSCGMSSYSASKAALRMAGDSLRLEMAYFGIHVVTVMPGVFKTDIVKQPHLVIESFKKQPKDIQDIYGLEFVSSFLALFDQSIR